MCGICGIWGRPDDEAISSMVASMHHRGPDDRGIFNDAKVSLGMTRLAIIDITSGGHQPMQTPDGNIVLVYNGELYNFRSERELLEKHGYKFNSTSDTEVVLRMYEHYGDDFLLRMRGMFALAIYDKRRGPGRERLLLARDQMGIKPLLYAKPRGMLIFASEIKALLASDLVDREVEPESLRLLLTYGSVYQPNTTLKGVKMLLPAHRLIFENGRERIERYWSLDIDRRHALRNRSYQDQVEEIASVLEESVRLQMISDVPLGAFLSGGVDSSLLVALMAQEVSGKRVKTFSVGFDGEGSEFDESGDAAHTARFIGTDHTRVMVTADDLLARINHIAYSLDQPSVDGVNSYFISMAARNAVTVAISGTGGDELFAGYPWFGRMAVTESAWRHHAGWKLLARSAVAPVVRSRLFDTYSIPRIQQLRYTTDYRTRYAAAYKIFGPANATHVLSKEMRARMRVGRSPYYDLVSTDELAGHSDIERVTALCLRGYTTNQLLRDIDAVSMAHSLEVRVPYLDHVVADAALSLPDIAKSTPAEIFRSSEDFSYRELGTKRIVLDVAKRFLPAGYDSRPKRGFGMPFDSWLRGPLRSVLEDTLCEKTIRRRGWLDADAVKIVKDDFLAARSRWPLAWTLIILELWAREVLDHSSSQSAGRFASAEC